MKNKRTNLRVKMSSLIFFLLFIHKVSYSTDLIMTGFIFDQTRTRLGREFYDLFAMSWDSQESPVSLNITISELTDPRFGSQISIFVEENLVYSTILRPRFEELENTVNEAVNAILQYILMLTEQQRALQEELKIFY